MPAFRDRLEAYPPFSLSDAKAAVSGIRPAAFQSPFLHPENTYLKPGQQVEEIFLSLAHVGSQSIPYLFATRKTPSHRRGGLLTGRPPSFMPTTKYTEMEN